nr:hypothetical protein [Streptomyces benahoarensis]
MNSRRRSVVATTCVFTSEIVAYPTTMQSSRYDIHVCVPSASARATAGASRSATRRPGWSAARAESVPVSFVRSAPGVAFTMICGSRPVPVCGASRAAGSSAVS